MGYKSYKRNNQRVDLRGVIMAELEQLNGTLNIAMTPDDLSVRLAFTDDDTMPYPLTGYTFAAYVDHAGLSTTMTVTNTDLAAGVIHISLTDEQAAVIGKGKYEWRLEWTVGGLKRTPLAGEFEIRYKR